MIDHFKGINELNENIYGLYGGFSFFTPLWGNKWGKNHKIVKF